MSEKKTPTQLRKHYKKLEWTFFGLEFVSVITPFLIIGIVNYDKYFVQYNGTKMSIAFFMALGVMSLAIYLISKKKFDNSFITLIVGWCVAAFIFQMLGQMITDLATIMWFGLIGILGAYGCELTSKHYKKEADKVKDAMEQANKENLVDDYKEELKQQETKKVKVKIKKGE